MSSVERSGRKLTANERKAIRGEPLDKLGKGPMELRDESGSLKLVLVEAEVRRNNQPGPGRTQCVESTLAVPRIDLNPANRVLEH